MKYLVIAVVVIIAIVIIVKLSSRKTTSTGGTTDLNEIDYYDDKTRSTASTSGLNSKSDNYINLSDKDDIKIAISSSQKRTISEAKTTVDANTVAINKLHIDLSTDWLSDVEKLVDDANIIIYNCSKITKPTTSENFDYHRNLYYRLITASKMLEAAENKVGSEVLKLHKIKFSEISEKERETIVDLQSTLPKLQSMLCGMKKNGWNLIHDQKNRVGSCGYGGAQWLKRNLESKLERYGK